MRYALIVTPTAQSHHIEIDLQARIANDNVMIVSSIRIMR
jgi:hypothetical protein